MAFSFCSTLAAHDAHVIPRTASSAVPDRAVAPCATADDICRPSPFAHCAALRTVVVRAGRHYDKFVIGHARVVTLQQQTPLAPRRMPLSGRLAFGLRTKDPYRRQLPYRWPVAAAMLPATYRIVGPLMLRKQHRRAIVVPSGGRAAATESHRCGCLEIRAFCPIERVVVSGGC